MGINEQDSYTKHRCYTYRNECVCECVDSPTYVNNLDVGDKPWGGDKTLIRNRHQEGTVQGNEANVPKNGRLQLSQSSVLGPGGHGKNFRHWNANRHLGRMVNQAVFHKKDKFWKPPSYYVSQEEVEAIKRCCDQETNSGVAWMKSGESCSHLKGETAAQIKERLAELSPTVTNTQVVDWLSNNGCGPAQYGQRTSLSNHRSGYNANTDGSGLDYDVNDMHHTVGGQKRASHRAAFHAD